MFENRVCNGSESVALMKRVNKQEQAHPHRAIEKKMKPRILSVLRHHDIHPSLVKVPTVSGSRRSSGKTPISHLFAQLLKAVRRVRSLHIPPLQSRSNTSS